MQQQPRQLAAGVTAHTGHSSANSRTNCRALLLRALRRHGFRTHCLHFKSFSRIALIFTTPAIIV
jgi:hypothetical protein